MNSRKDDKKLETRKEELMLITQKGDVSIDNFLELSQLYFFDQEYDKVVDITARALSVATEASDIAAILYNMALGYYGSQQNDEAIKYFQKSLDVVSLLDDSSFKMKIIGANHYYLRWCFHNNKEKFKEHTDNAKAFYEDLVNKYPEADTVDVTYEYLGYLYIDCSVFDKAIEYFKKALAKTVSNEHRQSCYLGISECLENLGNNIEAKKYKELAAQCNIEGHA